MSEDYKGSKYKLRRNFVLNLISNIVLISYVVIYFQILFLLDFLKVYFLDSPYIHIFLTFGVLVIFIMHMIVGNRTYNKISHNLLGIKFRLFQILLLVFYSIVMSSLSIKYQLLIENAWSFFINNPLDILLFSLSLPIAASLVYLTYFEFHKIDTYQKENMD